jgi:hypothetical protein
VVTHLEENAVAQFVDVGGFLMPLTFESLVYFYCNP